MKLLAVFLTFLKVSTSTSIYSGNADVDLYHGLGLGAYQQLADNTQGLQHDSSPAVAYLMPMALFDQSAAFVDLSQGSLPEPAVSLNYQSDEASYLDEKSLANQNEASLEDKEEESYGSEGTGVGALNLGEAGNAASPSSGPAINSYGHSSSGSSDWVPIKNPHRHH